MTHIADTISKLSFALLFVAIFATTPCSAFARPQVESVESANQEVTFNKHIRPILSRHCTSCHGPDEASREAGLRIDTFAGATEDLGDYAAIVVGKPDESEMIARITDQDDPMPPSEHGEMLSENEVRLLKQWIKDGAPYQPHWSFIKPEESPLPSSPENNWSQHPVDQFAWSAMQRAGLNPNQEAEPARLIRRLALDLTGLPPTQAMVDRYLASPNDETYSAIVDQLLADRAFGEHWASMWLDIARYADTRGYAGDEPRTIWPWRDWLIRTLNENKPYDQFTYEVLAGDLLPGATDQQILATAFHRNTLNNNEGGTNDEEFRTIAVKDRLSTTLNAWMGLTVRCAECHSHKYDPISHTEYHQLLDFFNQTKDEDKPNELPVLAMSDQFNQSVRQSIDRQIQTLRQQQLRSPVWQSVRPAAVSALNGTELTIQDDHSILASGLNPEAETYSIAISASTLKTAASSIGGLQIEMLPDTYHNGQVGRGSEGGFVLTQVRVTLNDGQANSVVALKDAIVDFAQPNFGAEHMIREEIAATDEPLGWAVYHPKHRYRDPRKATISFANLIELNHEATLHVQLVFNSKWRHRNAGRIRISLTQVEDPVDKAKSNDLDPIQRRLDRLTRQRNYRLSVPVLAERPENGSRTTRIMKRGNYQNVEEPVSARVPSRFNAFPSYAPRNRLGLARWLMHDDNPLTARVAVNRYWARLFGKGIVVTEEDFGTQGTPPTHPELLDWLAIDFRDNGWDTKQLLRKIVTSKTYRQGSRVSPQKLSVDPNNEWLARGPRVRLPAETLRDQVLAVSGLLSREMFGRPVYPPSPVYKMTNAFSATRYWDVSLGPDRYRRAVYTYAKRSLPHPLFETFDLSTRAVCSMRRIETNTPLQSFMTLNDEAFVEAARATAIRMFEHDSQLEQQITHGLQLALLRPASIEQVAALARLYRVTLVEYQAAPQQATQLLGIDGDRIPKSRHPEIAALTVVANVILNLDEFLTH